jgi:transcriptional regulator with XRE-family HTH domain
MFLGSNIKFLRNRKGLTQEAFANDIGITRSTLNNYENTNVLNPTAELLVNFSKYFNVSVDILLKTDLTQLSQKAMEDLEKGYDVFTTGTKLRVLATTVDRNNNENVELVSIRAKAGYVNGYGDLEYVKKLPVFQLPFLSRERKYRTFQITGDSMLPIPDKSYVIGEYIQNLNELKDGVACIVVTVDDGVVFKIVSNLIKESKSLLLSSLNPLYEPYEVVINKIKEVWKFTHYISSELPEPSVSNDAIVSTVLKLQKEVKKLQK